MQNVLLSVFFKKGRKTAGLVLHTLLMKIMLARKEL